ncbi:MAG TPA: TdeIII family type II restriction endonuclease [Candidatus Cloacimonetes bacterium]|nr:TdeIII family type II restriction endonuclease [Candidatus Cloacimonadota bacterium]
MGLPNEKKEKIEFLLVKTIENKLKRYARESHSMPFLVRLIQDSRKVAAYSFIHSIATSLGMSIYEKVSMILAEDNCIECFRNYDLGSVISKNQKSVIDNIIRELRNNERKPNYENDMQIILNASPKNGKQQKDGKIVDFYMIRDDSEYLFEIKTVKPNIDIFTKTKVKLLEWIARKRKPIRSILALPYNPYFPNPYKRFTNQNLMQEGVDFLVGDEYWNFIAGEKIFEDLLDIFDKVGKKWKEDILAKIEKVAIEKMENF